MSNVFDQALEAVVKIALDAADSVEIQDAAIAYVNESLDHVKAK